MRRRRTVGKRRSSNDFHCGFFSSVIADLRDSFCTIRECLSAGIEMGCTKRTTVEITNRLLFVGVKRILLN